MRLVAWIILALLACAPTRGAQAAETTASVVTYHGDAARSGRYVVPGLTWARAATAHLLPRFVGLVQGDVYAQPLYWRPPGAAHGRLIVVTEDNVVQALDAGDGRELWRRKVGEPAPYAALPCGDIEPLGMTGTPVIDAERGALYVDAMVVGSGGPRHLVYGLSLADGSVLPGWPVDVAAGLRAQGQAFDPRVQNQRSALTLVGHRLYVPFGGHFGDCGAYHGWVVGLRTDRPGVFGAWRTPARMGGIWAVGGLAYDGQSLFAVTGNTEGAPDWGGGEAVIRLPPDLRWRQGPDTFFAPANWQALDNSDKDLGGTNPLPIDLLTGDPHTGSDAAALLLAMGKDGRAYLIDRDRPGGIGHPLGVRTVAGGRIITAPAAYRIGSDVMVAFQAPEIACPGKTRDAGLAALRITAPTTAGMRVAWCATLDGRGAPIVTTTDSTAQPVVWVVGAEGDGLLHGFRGDTGAPLFDGGGIHMHGVRRFATVLVAEGRLYVAGDDRVHAFGFGPDRP